PEVTSATAEARALLPRSVPREDAVFNVQRVALLLAGLQTALPAAVAVRLEGRLPPPYRLKLFPRVPRVAAPPAAPRGPACARGRGPGVGPGGPRPSAGRGGGGGGGIGGPRDGRRARPGGSAWQSPHPRRRLRGRVEHGLLGRRTIRVARPATIVLVVWVALAVGNGLYFSFSVFLLPLVAQFHWSPRLTPAPHSPSPL